MRGALIHRARRKTVTLGPRNAQGEAAEVVTFGPWIPARVMERGSVAPKNRRGPETTAARVERGYEILLFPTDFAGAPITRPTASFIYETDCPVLHSPTIRLDGEPEVLTNGRTLIGYETFGDVLLERT